MKPIPSAPSISPISNRTARTASSRLSSVGTRTPSTPNCVAPRRPPIGRLSGAIGRHRLDGVLCVGDAPDCGGARSGGRPPLRGHGAEVLRALPVDCLGYGQPELYGGQTLGPR